jgi:hypothetical protein
MLGCLSSRVSMGKDFLAGSVHIRRRHAEGAICVEISLVRSLVMLHLHLHLRRLLLVSWLLGIHTLLGLLMELG